MRMHSINGLDVNLMDNSNIAMLSMNLESGSSPFTTLIVSPLIQSAVGILIDFKSTANASKQMYTCYYCPKMIETILSMCYIHAHH